ncbi:MAG: hypothetical protein JO261_02330 [Alphaproteobacteria bacterium]|nr:hypothetical protein [Alphaproteobacteria bacterium]MBV9692516.1 hypothetical protein [Alphaproteobacteria bacterium]
MYGPYVRDKFPTRNHQPSIIDIDIVHGGHKRHSLLWLTLAAALVAASAYAWQAGLLVH